MDNSNNRDVNPYVQRVNAPDGGADALRENYTQKNQNYTSRYIADKLI